MQEMSQIAQAPHLRKEVALFGLRRWLLAEFARSDAELGDIPIRAVSTDRGRRRNMEVTGKALNALIYVSTATRDLRSCGAMVRLTQLPLLPHSAVRVRRSYLRFAQNKVRC